MRKMRIGLLLLSSIAIATGLSCAVGLSVARSNDVIVANAAEQSTTFSYKDFSGLGTSGSGSEMKKTIDNVTITESKGYGNTSFANFYSAGNVVVSVPTGSYLKSIVFTCIASGTSNYGPSKLALNSSSSGSYSYSGYNGTWTAGSLTNVESVKFNQSAQVRVTSISVVFDDGQATSGDVSITYGANGGEFVDSFENSVSAAVNSAITLPNSEIIKTTRYAGYTTFTGWTDGVTNYAPGQSYTVTAAKTLKATYQATTDVLTVAQAKDIIDSTGTTATEYSFSVAGTVKSTTYYSSSSTSTTIIKDDEDNELMLYKMAGGEDLAEGNRIKATGTLVLYGASTYEMSAGCTYESLDVNIALSIDETDIYFSSDSTTLTSSQKTMSTLVATINNSTVENVTYSLSDDSLVDYDIDGNTIVVEGKKRGSLTITASVVDNGTVYSKEKTVYIHEVATLAAVTNIAYDSDSATLSWSGVTGADTYSVLVLDSEGDTVLDNTGLLTCSLELPLAGGTYSVEIVAVQTKETERLILKQSKADSEIVVDSSDSKTISTINTKSNLGFGFNCDSDVSTLSDYVPEINTSSPSWTTGTGSLPHKRANAALKTASSCSKFVKAGTIYPAVDPTGFDSAADAAASLNSDKVITLGSSSASAKITFVAGHTLKISVSAMQTNKSVILSLTNGKFGGTSSSVTLTNGSENVFTDLYLVPNSETSEMSLSTTKAADNGDLRITISEISEDTNFTFKNSKVKFAASIPQSVLSNISDIQEIGVNVTIPGSDTVLNIPADSSKLSSASDGSKYFTCSVAKIPTSRFSTVMTATAYIKATIDGSVQTVNMKSTSCSVNSLVKSYITEHSDLCTSTQIYLLNQFANYYNISLD